MNPMTALENEYWGVKFVYMTSHLDGCGANGNLNLRNNQIRQYCQTNNKILYDFADIESYDPDGLTNYMALYGQRQLRLRQRRQRLSRPQLGHRMAELTHVGRRLVRLHRPTLAIAQRQSERLCRLGLVDRHCHLHLERSRKRILQSDN